MTEQLLIRTGAVWASVYDGSNLCDTCTNRCGMPDHRDYRGCSRHYLAYRDGCEECVRRASKRVTVSECGEYMTGDYARPLADMKTELLVGQAFVPPAPRPITKESLLAAIATNGPNFWDVLDTAGDRPRKGDSNGWRALYNLIEDLTVAGLIEYGRDKSMRRTEKDTA